MQTDAPKISVIVRSMDRPLLQEALDSLAAQTYENLEVIVVNATGAEHRQLGERCGRHPLHLISTGRPLTRSEAANVGLDNVHGDWIGFLDDDDWLDAEHYQHLIGAILSNDSPAVVYSSVEVRGWNREALDIAPFDEPFSLNRLRFENYIPIHSLLFSRHLLGSGVRFDTAFEVYEDWDFLLQLAGKTASFFHVSALTAFYRASGTSGVGIVAEGATQLRARRQLFTKWGPSWSGADIDSMLQTLRAQGATVLEDTRNQLGMAHASLTAAHNQLDQAHSALQTSQSVLTARESQVDALLKSTADLETRLLTSEAQLNIERGRVFDMLHSTSWRVTSPLRRLAQFKISLTQRLRHQLLRLIQFALGQRPWPPGVPRIAQGFHGEDIGLPPALTVTPLISVIMPVYNACRANKQFLIKALDSIANQTYKNVELIIVNDGSTDETEAVCNEYLRTHPALRAQYLTKSNGGQSSARNFGVKACSGDYVGFLDQDDEWYVDKLEKVVPWLANTEIDVLYTDSDSIDADDKVTFGGIHRNYQCGWPHPKSSIEDILFKDIFVMPGLMTIKRSAFDAVDGFDEKLSGYEDDDLFLRLYERFRFYYLPIPTLRWRMYGDNYSFSHRMLTSRLYFWRKLLANYTDHGHNRYREQMISLRFFWQFMGQAKMQYLAGNALCWDSAVGAREIQRHLPKLQRMIFGALFLVPDRYLLPLLVRSRRMIG